MVVLFRVSNIGFCKIYDEQRKLHSNSIKCIEETIRICMERGFLIAFLSIYKREVVTIMSELFDEQARRDQYDVAIKKAYIAEGRAEGKTEGVLETLVALVRDGILSVVDAAHRANLSVSEFEALTGLRRA